MTWTSPAALRKQVQRWWDRGELLAEMVTGETTFPRRLRLKGPNSVQLAEEFDAVRAWIATLRALPHYRVELREIQHRVLGTNRVPREVWVDTREDALAVVGKRREAVRFAGLLETVRTRRPELLAWLARFPLKALALAPNWDRLLDVVDWLEAHPRPGVYLRQVDVPGVHSKFIEAHRGVLSQWLDQVLPPEVVDGAASGLSGFPRRYGFRERPQRVRLRVLDPRHAILPGLPDADITLDAGSFARLDPAVSRIFITENETNFLAFPGVPDSLIIFGAGYGFEVLAKADWLARCRIIYWGDIDTHGLAILDQLRSHLPDVCSMMMDRETLLAFETHWGTEDKPARRELTRLTPEERALYEDLRSNRLGTRVRLEQELIEWPYALERIQEQCARAE